MLIAWLTLWVNLESKKEQTVSINGQQYTSPGIVAIQRTDKDAVLKVKDCNKQVLLKKEINLKEIYIIIR